MTDKFIAAREEVGDYFAGGMDLDEAVAEVAAEHGLPPEALKNRVVRWMGPVDAFLAMKREKEVREENDRMNQRSFRNQTSSSREALAYKWARQVREKGNE